MTQPSLDKIIEQIQFCIVDAKALQLKMLERLLSIALLEALKAKKNPETAATTAHSSHFQTSCRA